MNETSRFSLICDELVSAIKARDRQRALTLVERLRGLFTGLQARPHPPADLPPLDCFAEQRP